MSLLAHREWSTPEIMNTHGIEFNTDWRSPGDDMYLFHSGYPRGLIEFLDDDDWHTPMNWYSYAATQGPWTWLR